jgi:hypothetical protein
MADIAEVARRHAVAMATGKQRIDSISDKTAQKCNELWLEASNFVAFFLRPRMLSVDGDQANGILTPAMNCH